MYDEICFVFCVQGIIFLWTQIEKITLKSSWKGKTENVTVAHSHPSPVPPAIYVLIHHCRERAGGVL